MLGWIIIGFPVLCGIVSIFMLVRDGLRARRDPRGQDSRGWDSHDRHS
jgi:hypothetical protein